jgi:uncharacterized membrane protein (DUF4010 family)
MSDPSLVLEQAQRLGMSLAIGFIVGVERGWKQRDEHEGQRVAGVRTFALAGMLGGISGLLAPVAIGLSTTIAVAFTACFIVFQFGRAGDGDNSATSAVAGILVFGLGAYAVVGSPMLAGGAAVAVAAILAFKEGLHAWLGQLTWAEIRSALLILVATFIVLPLLPAGPVDPWDLFDPRSLWLLTIAVATASFGGYIALRALGGRVGLAVSSLAGGLVSSTVVALDLARRVRASEVSASPAAGAAALATIASIARVALLAAVISDKLIAALWAPLAAAAAVLAAGSILLTALGHTPVSAVDVKSLRSPLDLVSVAKFAAVLGILTIAANLLSRNFGHVGVNAFAVSAGLVDVDAVALSVSGLLAQQLPVAHAAEALGLALASNQVFKIAAALSVGSVSFAWRFGALAAMAIGAGLVTHAILGAGWI